MAKGSHSSYFHWSQGSSDSLDHLPETLHPNLESDSHEPVELSDLGLSAIEGHRIIMHLKIPAMEP